MKAISSGIGSGEVKKVKISEIYNQPWSELISIDVKFTTSACFLNKFTWSYPEGICETSMSRLNQEFNYYRGLFPLKVFVTGPPCAGKTHFASKLSSEYGIPHITIKDVVAMGMSLTNEYGQ